MDNRLVLPILFVTLSWLSVGTYAQSTNMTTMSSNMTSPTMAPNMTTMGNNMTNATTAPHMTTMGNNMTNATTAPHMTTMGNNMTNATMAPQMTTMGTIVTAAPPLTPNTTVETLETPVNNSGCGTEQLCAAEPSSCNPANSGSCFFLGAKRQSGQNFEFALSGESDGYIAASLSTDSTLGGNDTTYVCANDNGKVKFFGALLNNGRLNKKELNVNSVRGKVNGNRIQCTFAATVPSSTARTTSFTLAISTGEFNATSGDLGSPDTRLQSSVVNLGNPNTTITNATMAGNNMTNATMAPQMTTMGTIVTAAPPLTPNTTVETLETPVNNSGCGTEQLCAAEPSSCNPANSGSCFFLGAKRQSGQNFAFALSGESDGYIAASLSTDSTLGGNDTTYVCANDNGKVKFFGALLNNGRLNKKELNVNSVRGKVNGNRIQCTFAATVPNSTARTTSFTLAISTGEFNSTSGDLGPPSTRLQSSVVNLGNPNTTVTNELSNNATNTTSSPTTTGHATTLQQSLTQALLISAGLLGLALL